MVSQPVAIVGGIINYDVTRINILCKGGESSIRASQFYHEGIIQVEASNIKYYIPIFISCDLEL